MLAANLQALVLCRKSGAYPGNMTAFLVDHLAVYGSLRRMLGTQERN